MHIYILSTFLSESSDGVDFHDRQHAPYLDVPLQRYSTVLQATIVVFWAACSI